ncbi:type VII secretion integral membrane protein EccD [Nocardia sp. CDC160]|uniref:type VII secretion integral membrane protein EccD n=1 Tax=Nocardia sp. CDC160 TaxID=3112166 RepID=UPI002DBD2439|nr:type VII secretion integral membrane protein EccD [Nocardia sp. CDC160]MEC3919261.1 type VII secretion integral membrane protein EccD [Nocardia sp. CDC160]
MTELSVDGPSDGGVELCRVSVIGGGTQVDLGLPESLSIASYIAEVVALIESRATALPEPDDGVLGKHQHWTLARIGRDPIPPYHSLAEADVHDGELLMLRAVESIEPPALFDDVIDAVSRLGADTVRAWSALAARYVGTGAGMVVVLVVVAVLALGKGDGIATALVTLPAALLSTVAAVIAARRYSAADVATMLSMYTVVLAAASAALAIPGHLGSPHLLLASVTALVAAVGCYTVTRVGPLIVSAVVTLSVFVGAAAAIRMLWSPADPRIGAGIVVAAVGMITIAPRIALVAAKLPVPPVPTAGAAIDPADHEMRPTIEHIGAVGATALPSISGLEDRARQAYRYQVGIVVASVAVASLGALTAADPLAAIRWQGLAFVVVVALVLCLRGRSYADQAQTATLVVGGLTTMIVLGAVAALSHPEGRVHYALALLGVGAVAVGIGVLGPHIEASPVWRRAGEIIEYLLIGSVVPLAVWLMGVYAAARNL